MLSDENKENICLSTTCYVSAPDAYKMAALQRIVALRLTFPLRIPLPSDCLLENNVLYSAKQSTCDLKIDSI